MSIFGNTIILEIEEILENSLNSFNANTMGNLIEEVFDSNKVAQAREENVSIFDYENDINILITCACETLNEDAMEEMLTYRSLFGECDDVEDILFGIFCDTLCEDYENDLRSFIDSCILS